MSQKVLNRLSLLQQEIIDCLANDYEDLKQIHQMLDRSVSQAEIREALWGLIQGGYVACFEPSQTAMVPVPKPDLQRLDAYWFALSELGEKALAELEAAS
jgi:hypothetical protein